MPEDISEIQKTNFLPANTFNDSFKDFCPARAQLLAQFANKLVAI
jgi:hypothetical protein